MKRYITDSSPYGKLIFLIGLLVAVPLVVLPFYPAEVGYAPAFWIPSAVSVLLGVALCVAAPGQQEQITEWQSSAQKGSLPVLSAWCYAFLAGAMPFVLSGQLSFTHALFESISGWSTTGLTVVEVTELPRIFLFHRSFMQYCGGLGFLIVVAMLVQGKHTVNLYNAEGHQDRIMPSLSRTARTIFLLDGGFLVVGAALYRLFGMETFDAVCHTMSALSTAGFTTRAGSIGAYRSLPIELVTVLLMLVGASNFAVLLLLARRKLRQVFRVTEIRVMAGLLAIFVPLAAASLAVSTELGVLESLRQALFGVVTTFSTTGYSTMDYALWPPFALGLIVLLMLVGGSTGSTAGGIKLLRTYFFLRVIRENLRRQISPARRVTSASYRVVRGKALLDNAVIADTFAFIACYLGVFIVGTLLVTLTAGCSLFDAMFEFASALGTIGITNGLTGPHTNTPTLVVEMVGMVLGRLEIFIVFIGVHAGCRAAGRWIAKTARAAAHAARSGG